MNESGNYDDVAGGWRGFIARIRNWSRVRVRADIKQDREAVTCIRSSWFKTSTSLLFRPIAGATHEN